MRKRGASRMLQRCSLRAVEVGTPQVRWGAPVRDGEDVVVGDAARKLLQGGWADRAGSNVKAS